MIPTKYNRSHNPHPIYLIDIHHKFKLGEWETTKMLSMHLLMVKIIKLFSQSKDIEIANVFPLKIQDKSMDTFMG